MPALHRNLDFLLTCSVRGCIIAIDLLNKHGWNSLTEKREGFSPQDFLQDFRAAIILLRIGVGLVGWLKRRRIM
jgi:hypothetical protein